MQSGKLSINSDNIFPIIKKWLYHDTDIYTRELISNGTDAITKLKKLIDLGEANKDLGKDFQINVIIDKENRTVKFCDNGIGMTDDEVEKYINQIAFSGAKEFMEQHAKDEDKDSIIGHFGLGFYSCFMVSSKVEIDTLSYKEGSKAVHWECTGDTDYMMSDSDKKEVGTTITLYINSESDEALDINKMRHVISNYCSYMPYPIYLFEAGKEEKLHINEYEPIWLKDPKKCTDDDYISFYHTNFNDMNNPLFWIHLNMDYPVKLNGILFFPKFNYDYELTEGQVKLYCNQVYVADNIKEVIPDFLLILKGAIDCPDLPLNVSRSFLQTDEYVKNISSYIIKKVSDKLAKERKNDEKHYQELWESLSTFIKYGCLKNDQFYEKVKKNIIYKTINGDYTSIEDYVASLNTEDYQKKIYYVADPAREACYIKLFKDNGQNALILNAMIDTHFIAFLEEKDHTLKFERIDSGINAATVTDTKDDEEKNKKEAESLKEILIKYVPALKDFDVKIQNFKSADVSSMIIIPESSRRMQDIFKIYGSSNPFGAMPIQKSFILNNTNTLVKYLIEERDKYKDIIESNLNITNSSNEESKDTNEKNDNKDKTIKKKDIPTNETCNLICNQLYDLARITNEGLNEQEMADFIKRSQDIMGLLIK